VFGEVKYQLYPTEFARVVHTLRYNPAPFLPAGTFEQSFVMPNVIN
jgi:hypothetical protein